MTALAFLAAFFVGCMLALIRHPIFGLVTYVAVLYVSPHVTWWGAALPSLRWSLIAALITFVAVLIHKTKDAGESILRNGIMQGLFVLVCWLIIQQFWALNEPMHFELLMLTIKYALLFVLIYKCVDSVVHLKYFLWAHAAGCFYLGTVVLNEYTGGRFEGFRSPGIDDANSGALHIVTGVLVTFVLFLAGRWKERAVAFLAMPITLNALVVTISRGAFLGLGVAGMIFNLLVPKKTTGIVRILSVVGLLLFIAITNPVYWERMGTIKAVGEETQGVDTGAGRLVLIEAQFRMSAMYPLGCGHRCTAVLSPKFLDARYLTRAGETKARASHNTFMTLLVEQGIPGAVMYILLLISIISTTLRLRPRMRSSTGLVPITYAATVAILGAITVGDLFSDFLKFEARVWFLALLIVLERLEYADSGQKVSAAQGLKG